MSKKINANEIDKKFDQGKDVLEHFELENTIKRVIINLPNGVLKDLDSLAKDKGVSIQSLLKIWIYDRIKEEKAR